VVGNLGLGPARGAKRRKLPRAPPISADKRR
jgi:hypothetical protein